MTSVSAAKKPLAHYLNLKYPMEIVEDEGAWVASVPDLPGCNSFGKTPTEAVKNVQETKNLWIEGQYENDSDIPEPSEEDTFSGRFVLRIPKILHRSLAYQARKQGVSLNQYASYLLSERLPINTFENIAHSLIASRANPWQGHWLYGRHDHGKTVMMGKLKGGTEFLMYLRKPPAQNNYKTSIPDSKRKLYLAEK